MAAFAFQEGVQADKGCRMKWHRVPLILRNMVPNSPYSNETNKNDAVNK